MRWSVAVVVLAGAFAGCSDERPDPIEVTWPSEMAELFHARLLSEAGNGTADGDWLLVPVASGPERPLTAAWLPMPIAQRTSDRSLSVELSLGGPKQPFVAGAIFVERHGQAQLLTAFGSDAVLAYDFVPGQGSGFGGPGKPFWHFESTFSDDARLGVVIGVEGPQGTVPLLVSLGGQTFDIAEPQDWLIASNHTTWWVPPAGNGTGFVGAAASEGLSGPFATVDIQVQDAPGPDGGRTWLAGGALRWCAVSLHPLSTESPGRWTMAAELFATSFNRTGPWTGQGFPDAVAGEATGYGYLDGVFAGDGDCSTSFGRRGTGPPPSMDASLHLIGFGASLDQMLGVPAATWSDVPEPLLPPV